MARALVIDDEPQVGRAVRRTLEAIGLQVDVATNGEDGLTVAATVRPDVVVIDLGLPDIHGIEVLERLRSWSSAPVIVLSGVGDEATKVRALRSGADDYVTKPFGIDELQARVEAALRRAPGALQLPTIHRFGELEVNLHHRSVTLTGEPVRLTPTEYSLLEAFVTNPGKLLTHWWLLDRVWGRGVGEEGRQYLRVYTRQIRSKLHDDAQQPTYILTEPGIGYRWIAPLDLTDH